MLTRLALMIAGCVSLLPVQAEVPQPPLCEQLHVVLASQQAELPLFGQPWLEQLAQRSGLQLHVHRQTERSLQDFAAGVHDLWLGASPATLQAAAAYPLQPALWQDEYLLWFRHGELSDLQLLPQLSGLRGAYWPRQRGQLKALAEPDELRLLASAQEVIQAVLDGRSDYFLSDRATVRQAMPAKAGGDDLEPLVAPVLVRPYYLAFSNNSACNDPALVKRLEAGIRKSGR